MIKRNSILVMATTGATIALAATAFAQALTVDMNRITDSGLGDKIGTVAISESKSGVTFKVSVKGLPAGPHGFHLHENGSCAPGMKEGKMQAGIAAGSHYDPEQKKSHKGPKGTGHKGDLPLLKSTGGSVDTSVLAPRLKLADVRGRALVIHEGGDTYKDVPQDGGGAGRIACGVIGK